MAGRESRDIPRSLVRGRDRFAAWRRTRKPGAQIPDQLWSVAVKLADAHGLSRTASMLKLDYNALKKRVAAKKSDGPAAPAAFIELSPPSPAEPCAPDAVPPNGSNRILSNGVPPRRMMPNGRLEIPRSSRSRS